jgi:FMN-dependent NADH-azoreductase
MNHVLHIDSSLFSSEGASSTLARRFVESLRSRHAGLAVTHRDLASDPVPHLDPERLTALMTDPAERTPRQQAIVGEADALIDELQRADLLVLGVPMYNFSVPTQLKAWFDHVTRAGTTFKYTEQGPKGLLEGKRAVIFTSRGGFHRDAASDAVAPFLRAVLGLIGIDEVEIVYAEGLAMGDAPRESAMHEAAQEVERLATTLPRAA